MKLVGLFAAGALLAMSSMTTTAAEGEAAQKTPPPNMEAMMTQMMKQQAKQQVKQTCSNKEMLSCMGFEASNCEETMTKMMDDVLKQCITPNMQKLMAAKNMSPEEREALNKTIESCANKTSDKHGFDTEKAKSCSKQAQSAE
ncbi:hypothetical protein [Kangiella shandongensis]|uniref:hypothetical protein n=1 Tax=Kangiella shandongensis TaxID=2763258 RepID=UPI001CBAF9C2|nr:hypothetical protein [Kangiella shandongensis]